MIAIGRRSAAFATALSVGIGLYLANLGCGGKSAPPGKIPAQSNVQLSYLSQALLVTDGIEIEFVDEGRTITAGTPFQPRAYFPTVPEAASVEPADLRTYTEAQGFYGVEFAQSSANRVWIRHVAPESPAALAGLRGAEIEEVGGRTTDSTGDLWPKLSLFRRVIRAGETTPFETNTHEGTLTAAPVPQPAKVRVHVPGRSQPLYGRLAFFPVYSSAEGSAARVYRLAVPDSYIRAATGGAVSVVYQPYDWTDTIWIGENASKYSAVSWALWMSDVPL